MIVSPRTHTHTRLVYCILLKGRSSNYLPRKDVNTTAILPTTFSRGQHDRVRNERGAERRKRAADAVPGAGERVAVRRRYRAEDTGNGPVSLLWSLL